MGILGTLVKVLAGVAVGVVIKLALYKAAMSTAGSFLRTNIIEPIHVDNAIAMGICVLGAVFIPNVFVQQIFVVALGINIAIEIEELLIQRGIVSPIQVIA